MVKIFRVAVQDSKKPFSFTKVSLVREVDMSTAQKIYEKSIKHVHIGKGIVWASIATEKDLGVPARTYLLIEGLPL